MRRVIRIEALDAATYEDALPGLATLLVDAVEPGPTTYLRRALR